MPFSDSQGKMWVADKVREIQPSTFLDIGPGAGTYGKMVKRIVPEIFTSSAVEVWGPYVEEFSLNDIYTEVFVCDARHIDPDLTSGYDLVIVGDVIEHMKQHEARTLLNHLVTSNKNVIISFPVLHLEQGSYQGNSFETHVEHWTEHDMDDFLKTRFFYVLDKNIGDVLAYYLISGEIT